MKFFIFSLFISFNLYGDIQKKDVKLLENINFMTEEYPPFNFFSKGEVTGFGVDILLELIKELKINKSRKDIKLLPWARGYKYVQNPEKRNMLFLMGKTTQRENLFKWVGPIPGNKYALLTYKGGPKIKNIAEAKNKKIAAIREDIGAQSLINLGHSKKYLVEVNKLKQLLGLVKKKRIPYFSYGLVGLKEKIKKAGFKESDFEVALTFKEFKLYYAFNKSIEDKTIKTYQNTLDKVMSNRILLKKIKEKYKKMNMYIPL